MTTRSEGSSGPSDPGPAPAAAPAPGAPALPSASGQYLSFRVAGEDYAVPIEEVREVLPYEAPSRVPRAAPSLLGVLNLRGQVIPVVDLGIHLGASVQERTSESCTVVAALPVAGEEVLVGLVVDAVLDVVDAGPGEREPVPELGAPVAPALLAGLVHRGAGFVYLLRLGAVFGDVLRSGAA